jgi:hypothetical protein
MPNWPWNPVELIEKVKPEASKILVILTLISITIGVVWIGFLSRVAEGPVVWGPGLAFGAFAAVFMMTATIQTLTFSQTVVESQVRRLQRAVTSLQEPKPPAFHIGCRIGRRRLECGLLEVTTSTRGLPGDQSNVRIHDEDRREARRGRFHHADLYDQLLDALHKQISRATRQGIRIESIGLALPGGVQPDRGQFDSAVHGVALRAFEDVSLQVAKGLQACEPDVLDGVFGAQHPDELTQIIHLDNDARCAARWLITDHPEWQDFACVFAGTGVGSGLVFDKRIFYGASFRAGEVGHANLNLAGVSGLAD